MVSFLSLLREPLVCGISRSEAAGITSLVFAALLGVIVLQSSSGMLVGRLKGTFNPKEDTAAAYASTQDRQQLLWRSIEVTKEHPLFGVGPGNFAQLSGNWHVAHNSFTQMSSEGGIPALIFICVDSVEWFHEY